MLKGIPRIISPELLKILCEMGHGDKIVLADANFPVESVGKNAKVVRCDGHGICELLEAILKLMPLDEYVDQPVSLMAVVPGDNVETPIWEDYAMIIRDLADVVDGITLLERFEFYKEAQKAYCIVATGESAQYANIMLQKGVIREKDAV